MCVRAAGTGKVLLGAALLLLAPGSVSILSHEWGNDLRVLEPMR